MLSVEAWQVLVLALAVEHRHFLAGKLQTSFFITRACCLPLSSSSLSWLDAELRDEEDRGRQQARVMKPAVASCSFDSYQVSFSARSGQEHL